MSQGITAFLRNFTSYSCSLLFAGFTLTGGTALGFLLRALRLQLFPFALRCFLSMAFAFNLILGRLCFRLGSLGLGPRLLSLCCAIARLRIEPLGPFLVFAATLFGDAQNIFRGPG